MGKILDFNAICRTHLALPESNKPNVPVILHLHANLLKLCHAGNSKIRPHKRGLFGSQKDSKMQTRNARRPRPRALRTAKEITL